MRRRRAVAVAVIAAFAPSLCSADVVWPALVLSGYLLSLPAIAIGLGVEIACLALLLQMPWRTAVAAGVTMNVASSVLGVVLVPPSGLVWEVGPGLALYQIWRVGTFNPGTWAATFVLAALVNAVVEAVVLRAGFRVPFSRRVFRVLALANCASVSVAGVAMWLRPPEY